MIKKQLIYNYFSQLITLLWWVFFLIFLPKYLWVEQYWHFMLILTYVSLLGIFMWVPIQEAIKKELVEEKLNKNWKIMIANWFLLRLWINLLFIIIFHFLYGYIEWLSDINYIYLMFIFLFINMSWMPQNIFFSLHKNQENFYFVLLEYFIQISLLLFFYFSDNFLSIYEAIIAFILWYAIPTIYYSLTLFIKNNIKLFQFDYWISKIILTRYFWLSISSISFLLLTNIDNVMISYYFSNIELWYYNIATNIVNKSSVFTISIVLSILPIFHLWQDKEIIKNNFNKYLKWLVGLNIILSIWIFIFSSILVKIIYWDWFDLSIKIMETISLFPLFAVLQVFFSGILTNLWYYQVSMIISIFVSLLNIVLNIIFVNMIWIIWISIATILCYFIWVISLFFIVKLKLQ